MHVVPMEREMLDPQIALLGVGTAVNLKAIFAQCILDVECVMHWQQSPPHDTRASIQA